MGPRIIHPKLHNVKQDLSDVRQWRRQRWEIDGDIALSSSTCITLPVTTRPKDTPVSFCEWLLLPCLCFFSGPFPERHAINRVVLHHRSNISSLHWHGKDSQRTMQRQSMQVKEPEMEQPESSRDYFALNYSWNSYYFLSNRPFFPFMIPLCVFPSNSHPSSREEVENKMQHYSEYNWIRKLWLDCDILPFKKATLW